MITRRDLQILLIDADDTLWENNIYFERVIASVQALLLEFGIEPASFRARLDDLERTHVPIYGYGTVNFCRSLVEAFEGFLPAGAAPSLASEVRSMALGIMNHPIELLDGVAETLRYLRPRHALYLVTKGDPEEQLRKVTASNLSGLFDEIEILSEKSIATYQELVHKHGWDPGRTWMVGNSPRSDINPALAAGLGAVFIPHPNTWVLEHEEHVSHTRLLELHRFADLTLYF
jgi:putative hydrolase of the HAD superfamily